MEWSNNAKKNIELGRLIFENHPEQYTEKRIIGFKKDLKRIIPDAEQEDIENAFFHSVYDYWVHGNNLREDIFYHFAEKSEEEKEEYITFRNRFNYYNFLNDSIYETVFKKKYETYLKFHKWYARDVIAIESEDDYEKFENFARKHKTFFVKPESLGLGIGVHKFEILGCNIKQAFDTILSESGISKSESWSVGNRVVLEEKIIQTENMAAFHPSSVNMIRLTTILLDNKVHYLDAWLRVGMNGSDIAAAAEGEIYCGVDLSTGIVDTHGYTEFGDVYEKHPNTGITFKGYKIERWNEMLEMAEELARVIPEVRYIGWDLAQTEHGWVIIEGNENGEFLGQLVYGKPYKKEFEKLINYKKREL